MRREERPLDMQTGNRKIKLLAKYNFPRIMSPRTFLSLWYLFLLVTWTVTQDARKEREISRKKEKKRRQEKGLHWNVQSNECSGSRKRGTEREKEGQRERKREGYTFLIQVNSLKRFIWQGKDYCARERRKKKLANSHEGKFNSGEWCGWLQTTAI